MSSENNIQNSATTTTTTAAATTTNDPIVITLPQSNESKNEKEKIAKTFPQKIMLALSILQLICGSLAALLQIILVSLPTNSWGVHNGGFGIWTGLVFGIAGGVGLIGAHRPSNCMVISMLVLSILSALFSLPLIVASGIGIGSTKDHIRWRSDDNENVPALRVMLAIHSIMLFVGLVQAVVAITTSAFSCRTICCRKRSNAGTVIFAPVNTNIDPRFVSVTLNTHQDPVSRPETTEQLDDLPPDYTEVELNPPEVGDKYQRFE